MKKIINFIYNIFYTCVSFLTKIFYMGIEYICRTFKLIFILIARFFDLLVRHFNKRKSQPQFFLLLILYLVTGWTLFKIFYKVPTKLVDNSKYLKNIEVNNNTSNITNTTNSTVNNTTSGNTTNNTSGVDSNLFRRYGATPLEQVNLNTFKNINSDTVGWLNVDGTTINYPVTKTSDNDYYLTHSFDRSLKNTGWVFMDYRNNSENLDYNTIIYEHNLLNNTSFGTLTNTFKSTWLKNSTKSIILITSNNRYVFKIFATYKIDPEVYYLQNTFSTADNFKEFVNKLKSRSTHDFGVDVSKATNIITLSTCTSDNKGRTVVHGVLVK
jgi:sortase B